MPKVDIPADEIDSVHSSLQSSNENVSMSSRTSSSSTNNNLLFFIHEPQPNVYVPIENSVPICHEPGLEAILLKASGTADLATLTHIQMRISSNVFGLHQMHIFLPSLIALNLNGSSLNSLRDLGSDLKVKYLNVSRCGLRSLDGINGFEAIEHLVADDNEISSVMQLCGLHELQSLSLRGNRIQHISTVAFLAMCVTLNALDLTKNSVTEIDDYRQKMKVAIPHLLILDGFAFDVLEVASANVVSDKFDSSECSSSLISNISKDTNDSLLDVNAIKALNRSPSCADQQSSDNVSIDISKVSESSSRCSTGDPIVGNIINKVRRRRKINFRRAIRNDDFHDDTSTSTTTSSTSEPLKFPAVLPQSTVELELGIINMEPTASTSSPNMAAITNSPDHLQQDTHQLIEMCRRWREASQKIRINDGKK